MNSARAQPSSNSVVDELRARVLRWLEDLRYDWTAHTLFGADLPHLIDPLPHGFPFGASSLAEPFHWTDDDTGNPWESLVTLRFGGRTHVASACWLIESGQRPIPLASNIFLPILRSRRLPARHLQIPARIYDDPLRPFAIGPDLVLDGLRHSVARHAPVRLSTSVVYHRVADPPAGPALYPVEVFCLVPAPEVIRRVGARFVKACLRCRTLIPTDGPDICATHTPRAA
ncbi:hypothetical protein B0H10DRAFT_2218739 [Mycena sp. CBHHK59/15]|nr:hypothetical protein B0H10DRAFT_2218739 [Mycena sp. CBHHK59/15]